MESGSNKSLYTLIAVVVFGIFLSLSYYLFQDQMKSTLATVLDGVSTKEAELVIGGNYLQLDDLDFFPYTNESYSNTNGVFEFSSTGLNWAGLGITYNNFEPYKTYSLTFTITKISGNITNLGGHSFISDYSEVYIDGVLMKGSWVSGDPIYPNDNLPHRVQVIFNSNNWTSTGDKNIYIQPNRQHLGDLTKVFKVRIEDLSVIQH